MRKIKFRAWDKEGNECINEPIGMVYMQDWLYRYSSSMPMPYKTNRYYFMQYIGLKDKNGVEIYEGDILETKCTQTVYIKKPNVHGLGSKTKNIKTKGIVICEWSSLGFEFNHIVKNKYGISIPECEVVGNIHENKDLKLWKLTK